MYYYVCILRKTRPRVCIIFICHSMQLCVCTLLSDGDLVVSVYLNYIKVSSVTSAYFNYEVLSTKLHVFSYTVYVYMCTSIQVCNSCVLSSKNGVKSKFM